MTYPLLAIDPRKIAHNTGLVAGLLQKQSMRLVGVAKGTSANLDVVGAMIRGGAAAIGDSRLANLARIREWGYRGETILLRAPGPSQCAEAVAYADTSLNSEISTVRRLGEAALQAGRSHNVILMVDLGDLREGVTAERAPEVAYAMEQVRGICLAGIGTNLACYGGVIPTVKTMELLLEVKEKVERRLGRRLERVSGGTSANLKMVLEQQMPPGITELRIGEGILLGNEAVCREAIPGCYADAFLLKAEVIEVQEKPSKPIGEIGQDAFGNVPYFEDRGIRRRALLALGRQDVDPEGLIPLEPGIEILGASSDHLICDIEDAALPVEVGSILEFKLTYSALLRASSSPYVTKRAV
ncbi:MAG TPA: alanine/ornithine racemase family PLP-dependent enzyme [Bacillota bacterium]|nr:alanine/ornithine racemase family PLP-dependent enzyme [Bacillota bacterium]